MAKILVVDDDARNLRLAKTALELAGHEVLSALGGAQGIEAALAHTPGMDGIAVLRHLRAEPRTATLRVAALTALAMRGDRERLLAEGFDGYLEKPIRYKEFLARVAALLEGSNE